MRIITVEIQDDHDVDEAFSVIYQALDDARIASYVSKIPSCISVTADGESIVFRNAGDPT